MADQNGIVAGRIESAVGLVTEAVFREGLAAGKTQGCREVKVVGLNRPDTLKGTVHSQ